MPDGLFKTDVIISQNFFLELDGETVSALISVSGLDLELSVASVRQVGKDGKQQLVKSLGTTTNVPDLTVTRIAPLSMEGDKVWEWFNSIRKSGTVGKDRTNHRKNGSIVLYDQAHSEVSRFNFFEAWPTKISTDQLSVESSDAVKETITFTLERLDRVK